MHEKSGSAEQGAIMVHKPDQPATVRNEPMFSVRLIDRDRDIVGEREDIEIIAGTRRAASGARLENFGVDVRRPDGASFGCGNGGVDPGKQTDPYRCIDREPVPGRP